MRALWVLLFALLCVVASAQKIVLLPLDNRPATGQYAELIGRIGGAQVLQPPFAMLGNFTTPGRPDEILQWIESLDLASVDAFVVSLDMLCFGSLFESRKNNTTVAQAQARIDRFMALRRQAPQAKLYMVSTIMRLTPSATHDALAYRMALARYVELRARGGADERTMQTLRAQIPPGALEAYDAARARNHRLQRSLVASLRPDVDLLVFGQDDASVHGPHVAEKQSLRALVPPSSRGRVVFCEGIDQIPSVLVSRALLDRSERKPRVFVRYSDPEGARQIAQFETQPLSQSVADQVVTSGATLATGASDADYTLYVNTPNRRQDRFLEFVESVSRALDAGEPVAVADTNISRTIAAPDAQLYTSVSSRNRPMQVLAYSAWNTAANTLGTSVAAANLRMLTLWRGGDVDSEVAHKQFVLYRMTNDFAFNTLTRPVANALPEGPRKDVLDGPEYEAVNAFVRTDLSKFLRRTFFESFLGRRFEIGGRAYEIVGITDLSVYLPWPRPYEVRLDFDLQARAVESLVARHFVDQCAEADAVSVALTEAAHDHQVAVLQEGALFARLLHSDRPSAFPSEF
jgi:hypothetical protein